MAHFRLILHHNITDVFVFNFLMNGHPCVTVMLAGGKGWCAAFLWKWLGSFSLFQRILLSRLISWDCWIEDNSINYLYLFKCFNEGVLYYFTDNVHCCQSTYIPSLKKIWLFITVQTQTFSYVKFQAGFCRNLPYKMNLTTIYLLSNTNRLLYNINLFLQMYNFTI